MKTKWGNARINSNGYYQITSCKEGNHGKELHRLIWEDFWKTEAPKGYVIHHRNHIKTDNCILNLQLMRKKEHDRLHHNNKIVSNETKMKMSKHQNTSGYFRVYKQKCKACKEGFIWVYGYYENGKRKYINSTDIEKLETKVKSKGLTWKKLNCGGGLYE